ncbi:MAG: RsmE family RNA methyltransferase [candidate division SR1 bacterium]|nr:RsmE family RNA methyltransferase [candidate division SR1 bacterium]
MQLFVTEYTKKDKNIVIADIELLSQLRKVLRTSIGDSIWIQSPENESIKIRYEVRVDRWDNKQVEGTIVSEQTQTGTNEKKSMIIAMPNKRDKIELIVQKLTECGLDQIIFWPSERSVLKEWNPKKEERLQKIIKEAVEQSRGRAVPKLIFTTSPKTLIGDTPLVIFDKKTGEGTIQKSDQIYGLVGPEGGLTPRDYQTFEGKKYDIYGLGDTILRTETAAIIGGWILKNNHMF